MSPRPELNMTERAIHRYIVETFPGNETATAYGGTFFFQGADRMFPFATIVTTDENDQVSNLDRPGVFRLNVGVRKETFKELFPDADAVHDFTTLDLLMPHPVYGMMYWVCVLNPSEATFEKVKPLLAESYELAAARERGK